ncbi:MAG: hypothetical protein A3G01_00810 [Candidatus Kerfeldbacteria bacterium RIFCSPLOWO2_12_FULL_43_9]|nr:MAG: hypothetical protein A3G01_00810 [Candidatus Kerfeldbacteria bacterium RIFCSPLOWO2_12_FULL_43_9]
MLKAQTGFLRRALQKKRRSSENFSKFPMKKILIFISILGLTLLNTHEVHAESLEESKQQALNFLIDQTKRPQWIETAGASTVDWTLFTIAGLDATQRINEEVTRIGLQNFPQTQATDYARKILTLTAFGFDPRNKLPDRNLIQEFLNNYYHHAHIGDQRLLNDDVWGMIALRAAGIEPTDAIMQNITNTLLQHQNQDGGFPLIDGGESDVDNTAAAIIALRASNIPKNHASLQTAKNFLRTKQHRTGGFVGFQDTEPNTDSTSWVVLALVTLEESIETWRAQLGTPLDFIQSMKTREGDFCMLWIKSKGRSQRSHSDKKSYQHA